MKKIEISRIYTRMSNSCINNIFDKIDFIEPLSTHTDKTELVFSLKSHCQIIESRY